MATSLVALGSNLGESREILQRAIAELDSFPGIAVAQRSGWFVTDPVGGPEGQDQFVNAAIRVETSLSVESLHARLREVELRLGRERRERWAARIVDLDLLLFDELVLRSDDLTIPHPRMAFRRFVLEPAAEVAADMRHPLIGWTVRQLLDHLNQAIDYVALTGSPGVSKTDLARKVSHAAGVRLIEDPARQRLTTILERDVEQEIAILRQRAAGVARENWPHDDRGAVSDFWIGQSLAYGVANGLSTVAIELEQLRRQLNRLIVSPKLLVWLDASPDGLVLPSSLSDDGSPSEPSSERRGPGRAIWREIIDRFHQGPVLRLEAGRPEWALTELTAAIQAMR